MVWSLHSIDSLPASGLLGKLQADVGGRSFWAFQSGTPKLAVSLSGDLAPLLRRVVFVGEAPLRAGFDFQRVGLRVE